jgi:hypothetical protein
MQCQHKVNDLKWYYFSVSRLLEDRIEAFIAKEDPTKSDLVQMREFNTLVYDLPGSPYSVWNGFVIASSEEQAHLTVQEALIG